MIVKVSKTFRKSFAKLPQKMQQKVKETLTMFGDDPLDPRLRNHLLVGWYRGFRSLDVTGDIRIIFSDQSKNGFYEVVALIDVGTHSQLYG